MSIEYNAYKNRLALYIIFALLRLQGLPLLRLQGLQCRSILKAKKEVS